MLASRAREFEPRAQEREIDRRRSRRQVDGGESRAQILRAPNRARVGLQIFAPAIGHARERRRQAVGIDSGRDERIKPDSIRLFLQIARISQLPRKRVAARAARNRRPALAADERAGDDADNGGESPDAVFGRHAAKMILLQMRELVGDNPQQFGFGAAKQNHPFENADNAAGISESVDGAVFDGENQPPIVGRDVSSELRQIIVDREFEALARVGVASAERARDPRLLRARQVAARQIESPRCRRAKNNRRRAKSREMSPRHRVKL